MYRNLIDYCKIKILLLFNKNKRFEMGCIHELSYYDGMLSFIGVNMNNNNKILYLCSIPFTGLEVDEIGNNDYICVPINKEQCSDFICCSCRPPRKDFYKKMDAIFTKNSKKYGWYIISSEEHDDYIAEYQNNKPIKINNNVN